MAEATWEKTNVDAHEQLTTESGGRLKFLIGGALILAAVAYLIVSGTAAGARFYITVEELVNDPTYVGKTVRISGAVIGESIVYDGDNLILDFTIANIPQEFDDLATALNEAVNDKTAAKLEVRVENQVKPDLLQHEAQAILTGELQPDGTFVASELLLKCPSRFEEAELDDAMAAHEDK
jgi:cytochrome c-type biogenesis protein CcmE